MEQGGRRKQKQRCYRPSYRAVKKKRKAHTKIPGRRDRAAVVQRKSSITCEPAASTGRGVMLRDHVVSLPSLHRPSSPSHRQLNTLHRPSSPSHRQLKNRRLCFGVALVVAALTSLCVAVSLPRSSSPSRPDVGGNLLYLDYALHNMTVCALLYPYPNATACTAFEHITNNSRTLLWNATQTAKDWGENTTVLFPVRQPVAVRADIDILPVRFRNVGMLVHGHYNEELETFEILGLKMTTNAGQREPKKAAVLEWIRMIRGITYHRLDIFACNAGSGDFFKNLMYEAQELNQFPAGIAVSTDVTGTNGTAAAEDWVLEWNAATGYKSAAELALGPTEAVEYFGERFWIGWEFTLGFWSWVKTVGKAITTVVADNVAAVAAKAAALAVRLWSHEGTELLFDSVPTLTRFKVGTESQFCGPEWCNGKFTTGPQSCRSDISPVDAFDDTDQCCKMHDMCCDSPSATACGTQLAKCMQTVDTKTNTWQYAIKVFAQFENIVITCGKWDPRFQNLGRV